MNKEQNTNSFWSECRIGAQIIKENLSIITATGVSLIAFAGTIFLSKKF